MFPAPNLPAWLLHSPSDVPWASRLCLAGSWASSCIFLDPPASLCILVHPSCILLHLVHPGTTHAGVLAGDAKRCFAPCRDGRVDGSERLPGSVGMRAGGLRGEELGAVCSAAALPHGADKTPRQTEKPPDRHRFPQVHVLPATLPSAAGVSPTPYTAVPTLRPGQC